ncbi:hypothetical protein BY996DRAFT_6618656 [Phakopsora pachyrhizi]|nr:hypothetical protein BY996DRAFT_6618656 [Phakopsora pachyrhizi]
MIFGGSVGWCSVTRSHPQVKDQGREICDIVSNLFFFIHLGKWTREDERGQDELMPLVKGGFGISDKTLLHGGQLPSGCHRFKYNIVSTLNAAFCVNGFDLAVKKPLGSNNAKTLTSKP